MLYSTAASADPLESSMRAAFMSIQKGIHANA